MEPLLELFEFINRNKFAINKTFNHFALIYKTNGKKIQVLSYGINHIRRGISIHAEVDAINNLPNIVRKKKKLVKVSLLVIRVSRSRTKLGDSKCCIKCCETIYKIPPLRGYTIDSVTYSTPEGNLESSHPITLLIEDDYHMSTYYTTRKYKPKIRNKVLKNPGRKEQLFIKKKSDSDSDY